MWEKGLLEAGLSFCRRLGRGLIDPFVTVEVIAQAVTGGGGGGELNWLATMVHRRLDTTRSKPSTLS